MFRARILLALLFTVLVAPAAALAYPISPMPLWPLTAEAKLIVVAEVTDVEWLPDAEDGDTAVAPLRGLRMCCGQCWTGGAMRIPRLA